MKILISGASGLIGTAVTEQLQPLGHQVFKLVRKPPKSQAEILWDPIGKNIDKKSLSAIENLDFAINLSGYSIGKKRWNSKIKSEILTSRILTTEFFVQILNDVKFNLKGLLSASAIGYYGSQGNAELSEDFDCGNDFLSTVCQKWETVAMSFGSNVTLLRSGIVLSEKDGILAKQLFLFKHGLGARLGNGKQWISWISLQDEIRAIIFCMSNLIFGPINLTAPKPVTNLEFTEKLATTFSKTAKLAIPKPVISTIFGKEMAEQLLFASQKAMPTKLLTYGFEFLHPDIDTYFTDQFHTRN